MASARGRGSRSRPGRPPHRLRLGARRERGDLRRRRAYGRGAAADPHRGCRRSPAGLGAGGRRIVWESGRPGAADLLVCACRRSRKAVLVRGRGDDAEPAWSPDGSSHRVLVEPRRPAPALGGRRDRRCAGASRRGSGSSLAPRVVAGRTATRLHARVGRGLGSLGARRSPTEARGSSREEPAATRGPTGRRPRRHDRVRPRCGRGRRRSGSSAPKERLPARRSRGRRA